MYIMHHYGGAYSDIKHFHFSQKLEKTLDKLYANNTFLAAGFTRKLDCNDEYAMPCWKIGTQ